MIISVIQNGVQVGYVKSISYSKYTFAITKNRLHARRFSSNEVHSAIDVLASMSFGKGYVFIYNMR